MRILSRRMPKALRRATTLGRVIAWMSLLGLFAAYLYALWSYPVLVWLGTLVLSLTVIRRNRIDRAHLARFAETRQAESICDFRRSFNVRKTDTWVIRAVYEQLQDQLRWAHPSFPVRADDRLVEDLKLDPDDIDLDIVSNVSGRTGRSMRNTKANPFYGRVETVGDLVAFFCAQDRQEPNTRLQPAAAGGMMTRPG